jgi:predicted nucleic-acid-binding protein
MRGIDTNVLLRLVLEDDHDQARAVRRLTHELVRVSEPLFVTSIVFCEFVWVLHRVYKLSRASIADALQKLVESDQLIAEHGDETREAMELYRIGPGDFADYMIGLVSQSAGCRDTVTFDRSLAGSVGFSILR